jgi:RNA polymerase sigma-70 factor (ECF subfamily)
MSEQVSLERRREFDGILSASIPRFRRMAMRWLRNAEDAEDAVQEAMLSAFRNIARFDGRARMSTWVTAIVINAVRMRLRSRSRSRTVSLDEAQGGTEWVLAELVVDSAPNPEQTLEEHELRALVVKLTACLSPCQRDALRLCQHEGRSIREAAAILGVAEGTVKAQLARGRAKLAERCRKVLGLSKTQLSRPDRRVRGEGSPARYRDDTPAVPYTPIPALAQPGGYESWAGA